MSSYELLQPIATKIDSALATYITSFSSNLISAISPIVMTGLTLYFIWVGIAYIKGLTDESLSDIAWHIFRVGLIVSVSMSVGSYQTFIVSSLQNLPDELTNTLLGGGATSGSAFVTLVDNILGTGIETSQKYYSMIEFSPMSDLAGSVGDTVTGWFGGDTTNEPSASGSQVVAPLLCGTAVLFGTILCLIVGCFWYLATKFLLAILLGMGALFIICLVWESTRGFFGAWLNALVMLMLINLMITGCFTIFSDIFNSGLNNMAQNASEMSDYSDLPVGQAIGIFFYGLLTCATLLIMPSMASMLSQGGFAMGGVAGATRSALGSGGKAVSGSAQATMKAGTVAKTGYSKAKQGASAVGNYFRK